MSDKRFRVVTAIGSDRPGLVSRISSAIREAGANIEDSRMAVLGGEFALMVLLSGSAEVLKKADQQVNETAEQLELSVVFKDTSGHKQATGQLHYRLQVTGLDQPGIVHGVCSVLALHNINVAALDTDVVHAPLTGTPTFLLNAEIEVPPNVSMSKLRASLGETCDQLQVDFTLESAIA